MLHNESVIKAKGKKTRYIVVATCEDGTMYYEGTCWGYRRKDAVRIKRRGHAEKIAARYTEGPVFYRGRGSCYLSCNRYTIVWQYGYTLLDSRQTI